MTKRTKGQIGPVEAELRLKSRIWKQIQDHRKEVRDRVLNYLLALSEEAGDSAEGYEEEAL